MFFTCAGCSIFSDQTVVTRFRSVLIWSPGSVKMQSGPVESGDSRVSVFAFCGFGLPPARGCPRPDRSHIATGLRGLRDEVVCRDRSRAGKAKGSPALPRSWARKTVPILRDFAHSQVEGHGFPDDFERDSDASRVRDRGGGVRARKPGFVRKSRRSGNDPRFVTRRTSREPLSPPERG